MDNNCRPLEHFKFLLDGQWAENMHKPNRHSVHHPGPPSPLSSSSSLSCFVESNEKGLKIQRYPQEHSHWIPGLWHSKHRGTHDWLGVAHSHFFVLFVVIWYIIFCLYKTGPRKNNTTHHLIFVFLFFLTKTWGEETTFLHNCLTQNATSDLVFLIV